jgi:hypothetical protein
MSDFLEGTTVPLDLLPGLQSDSSSDFFEGTTVPLDLLPGLQSDFSPAGPPQTSAPPPAVPGLDSVSRRNQGLDILNLPRSDQTQPIPSRPETQESQANDSPLGPDDLVRDGNPNAFLTADGQLLPGERARLTELAVDGDPQALAILQASDQAEALGVPLSTFALPLARAGLDLAAQYLPQGSQAQQIATGARRIGDILGLPQASSNPTVEVYTNRAINAINTGRNILRGF